MSSSFHPQTDGQTKRVNQTLETYLRHFVSVGLNDWDTLLSRAEFALNAAINETIRAAPFELTYGYRPRTPVGEVVKVVHPASAAFVERLQSSLRLARKLLIAAQQRQKALADKRGVDRVYKVGIRYCRVRSTLTLSIASHFASFSPNGLVHLKSCSLWDP
jgi:hypothetical protein